MSAALKQLSDYGSSFQIKVLHSLVKNREFLSHIRDMINESFFDHIAHKWVVNHMIKYFDKYRSLPSIDYFVVETKKEENEVLKIGIKEQLKKIYQTSFDNNEEKEYIEEEFILFCINQKLKNALLESVDLLKKGQFEDIRSIIDEALKAGQDRDIGHSYVKNFEDRYDEKDRSPVPTPWKLINLLLDGGLGKGDLGIIYGGPGGGKSWMLAAIGAAAILLGLKVLHYTLELGEGYVGKRYDSIFTKIPVQDLSDFKDKIKEHVSRYQDNLIIKEYPPKRATLNTLKAHIQKCKDLGFEADLIIIDYIDLLKPPSSRTSRKEDLDDLYYESKGLAKELQLPVWSVSQVNRDGHGDAVVEGNKSAGSYDKLMIADFCLSVSRTRKDKVDGTGRGHIMKNRYGADGMTYNMSINTEIGGITFLEEYSEGDEEKDIQKEKRKLPNDIEDYEKTILKDKFKDFEIE